MMGKAWGGFETKDVGWSLSVRVRADFYDTSL